MTPKQTAIETVERLDKLYSTHSNRHYLDDLKQAALLLVDTHVNALKHPDFDFEYWDQVKKEIEKLFENKYKEVNCIFCKKFVKPVFDETRPFESIIIKPAFCKLGFDVSFIETEERIGYIKWCTWFE